MEARRRTHDSPVLQVAGRLEHLPLAATPVALGIVLVVFEVVVPWAMSRAGDPTLAGWAVLFEPLIRAIGLFLAVMGAVFGVKGAIGRLNLVRGEGRIPSPAPLSSLSWPEVEDTVTGMYTRLGYQVSRTSGPDPESGLGLEVSCDGLKRLVQVFHGAEHPVGIGPVRGLVTQVTSEGAAGGVVVSSSGFTPEAAAWAGCNRLELIDGRLLDRMAVHAVLMPAWMPSSPQAVPAPAEAGHSEPNPAGS